MENQTICEGLQDNPDISGIGVRYSFYIQAFLTVLIAYLPGADVAGSYLAMSVTSWALWISGLVLLVQNELSEYQGVLISILLFIHGFAAASCLYAADEPGEDALTDAIRSIRQLEHAHIGLTPIRLLQQLIQSPIRTVLRLYGRFARTIYKLIFSKRRRLITALSPAWTFSIVIWADPMTAGSQPECNEQTMLNLLGLQFSVGRFNRMLSIMIIASVLSQVYALSPFIWVAWTMLRGRPAESRPRSPPSSLRMAIRWHWTPFFIFLIPWLVCFLALELTIRDNTPLLIDPSDKAWTLGQIFPMVMVLVPLLTLLNWIVGQSRSAVAQSLGLDMDFDNLSNGDGEQAVPLDEYGGLYESMV